MCWFSAEHSGHRLVNAEVGERLSIRQVHGSARWVVRESEMTAPKPAAVCLLDGTRIMFRPSEDAQAALGIEGDSDAVFRMLFNPKRDVFQLQDGRELGINALPTGLVLDVLVIPGKEKLSAILDASAEPTDKDKDKKATEPLQPAESVLARVLRLF